MKILFSVFLGLLAVQFSNAFPHEELPEIRPTPEELPEIRPTPESLEGPFRKQDCFKDTQGGPFYCMALFYRYKWSDQDQDCVKAVYGGCHPTKNNFRTLENCRQTTVPICRKNERR